LSFRLQKYKIVTNKNQFSYKIDSFSCQFCDKIDSKNIQNRAEHSIFRQKLQQTHILARQVQGLAQTLSGGLHRVSGNAVDSGDFLDAEVGFDEGAEPKLVLCEFWEISQQFLVEIRT
jgi:hypothetical protein